MGSSSLFPSRRARAMPTASQRSSSWRSLRPSPPFAPSFATSRVSFLSQSDSLSATFHLVDEKATNDAAQRAL
eukprot:4871458-Pleurochrysis_carterae.AAC.1